MSDEISAALEAACAEWMDNPMTGTVREGMGAAIAAFLQTVARTIPADHPRTVTPVLYLEDLARAVQERAAQAQARGGEG
jgi:hypothetical protein